MNRCWIECYRAKKAASICFWGRKCKETPKHRERREFVVLVSIVGFRSWTRVIRPYICINSKFEFIRPMFIKWFVCGAAYTDFLVMVWFSFEFIVIFMLNLMLYSSSLGEIAHWIGKKKRQQQHRRDFDGTRCKHVCNVRWIYHPFIVHSQITVVQSKCVHHSNRHSSPCENPCADHNSSIFQLFSFLFVVVQSRVCLMFFFSFYLTA